MKLTCEKLVADVPAAGGHVNHIVADTNVVIDFLDDKGNTNHATGDKAVYVYSEQGGVTNETVTLTGNPQMENAQGTLTGDVIVWDRLNNHFSALNQKMIFRQSLSGIAANTNSPPATAVKTNPRRERVRMTLAPNPAPNGNPRATSNGLLLTTGNLVKAYRSRRVVDDVSISVGAGEIVGLLGPNGAGKTTTFNMVVGLVKPDRGAVTFSGHDIANLPMHRRARLGIGYLTQEPSVFRKLTVEQNILAILETCACPAMSARCG